MMEVWRPDDKTVTKPCRRKNTARAAKIGERIVIVALIFITIMCVKFFGA
jgi:hypothetical protein